MAIEYDVVWSVGAIRAAKRLDRVVARRIFAATELLALNPRPPKSKGLRGFDELFRIRVGDYRVVYRIRETQLIVTVITVGHRKDIYRGLSL